MRRLTAWVPLAATALLAAGVCLQMQGVNGPSEWRWAYHPLGLNPWAWVALGAAVWLAFLAARWSSAAGSDPVPRGGLATLMALGLALTLALAAAQPDGMRRVLAALVSRHVFSFVYDSGVAPPTAALLRDYPAATEDLHQHTRTHPPGGLVLVRALDAVIGALGLPDAEGEGLVGEARVALEREARRAGERRHPASEALPEAVAPAAPVAMPSPRTVVALAFLLPALSVLAAWPLARLGRAWGLSPGASLLGASLWLLVPARSLFTPSLDQALPALGVAAAGLATLASAGAPLAAGAVLGLACLVSYGYLPLLPWIGLLAALGESAAALPRTRRALRAVLVGLGFLVPWVLLALLTGYEPLRSLRAALAVHAELAVEGRTYLTWLLWNPYDLALLLGPCVLCWGIAAARRGAAAPAPVALRFAARGLWGLLALLWVLGNVRGEVGRIWLFLMPFACLFAAAGVEPMGSNTAAGSLARRPWVLLAAQGGLLFALAASMVFVA